MNFNYIYCLTRISVYHSNFPLVLNSFSGSLCFLLELLGMLNEFSDSLNQTQAETTYCIFITNQIRRQSYLNVDNQFFTNR